MIHALSLKIALDLVARSPKGENRAHVPLLHCLFRDVFLMSRFSAPLCLFGLLRFSTSPPARSAALERLRSGRHLVEGLLRVSEVVFRMWRRHEKAVEWRAWHDFPVSMAQPQVLVQ